MELHSSECGRFQQQILQLDYIYMYINIIHNIHIYEEAFSIYIYVYVPIYMCDTYITHT